MKKRFCMIAAIMTFTLSACSGNNEVNVREDVNDIESSQQQIDFVEQITETDVTEEIPLTIDGLQLVDGQEVPVNVSFSLIEIRKGEEACKVLESNNYTIEETDDMEYIVITLTITYNSGGADLLYMGENDSSLESARLKFTLSNGDSNAEDLTMYLDSNIYDLIIPKGVRARGEVAFLRKKNTDEPLVFQGFNKKILFSTKGNINVYNY